MSVSPVKSGAVTEETPMGYRMEQMPPDWVGVGAVVPACDDDVRLYPGGALLAAFGKAWEKFPDEHRDRAVVITLMGDDSNYLQLGYFKP